MTKGRGGVEAEAACSRDRPNLNIGAWGTTAWEQISEGVEENPRMFPTFRRQLALKFSPDRPKQLRPPGWATPPQVRTTVHGVTLKPDACPVKTRPRAYNPAKVQYVQNNATSYQHLILS